MKKATNQVQVKTDLNLINSVVLTGYVGTDLTIKTFGNQKLARINLAVNEYLKNKTGETIKRTNWFTISCWNNHADLAEQEIKKGSRITIVGKLQTGSYEAKDGTTKYTTDIYVNELNVLKSADKE